MGNTLKASKPSTAKASQVVQEAIATYPVVIFSKTYCPYCISAKRHIAAAGKAVVGFQAPKTFELNSMGALGAEIQAYLAQTTGRRTVPNVFIAGNTVGGGDEVAGYARRGVLKQMLARATTAIAAQELSNAKQLVEDAIENNPVVVFSKTTCPYCSAAKSALTGVAARVEKFDAPRVIEINTMGELGMQVQAYLAEKTGRRTVPNVFLNGKSIGGGDDVRAYAASGQLDRMVSDAIGVEESEVRKTPKDIVDDAVASNTIAVFSKSYCPYCMRAKSLLTTTAQSLQGTEGFQQPKVFELDEMLEGEAIQHYLLEKTGQRTVPNIFIGGKHIGGSDDLAALAGRGALVDVIKSAQDSAAAEPDAAAPAEEPTELTAEEPTERAAEEPTEPTAPTSEDAAAAATAAAADATTATDAVPVQPATKEIVFGAGCFWGVELAFQRVVGVVKTEVGYSNGKVPQVTYEAICTGITGAAEVVRVWYDPNVVTLAELLKVWESRHDPTSLNKQGNDIGTQYRSAVYYTDQEQADEVAKWDTDASQRLGKPIVTEVAPVRNYCVAEKYHQRYLEKKGQSAEKGAATPIRCYG